jgi:hypothetical protein
MEKNDQIQTLHQLIEAITEREGRKSTGMFRTIRAHIAMAANRDAHELRLSDLADLREVLCLYVYRMKEEGHFHGHTPRSYMNYFRILLKKAEEYTGARCSPEILESWKPILEAVLTAYNGRGVVKAAIRSGIPPQEYSDGHLDRYCEERRRLGRHPSYLRQVAQGFRDGIIEAGLTGMLPRLRYPPRREEYGVPFRNYSESRGTL